jgi:hypothetical protein
MDHQALADVHADVVDGRRVGRVVGPEHQVAGAQIGHPDMAAGPPLLARGPRQRQAGVGVRGSGPAPSSRTRPARSPPTGRARPPGRGRCGRPRRRSGWAGASAKAANPSDLALAAAAATKARLAASCRACSARTRAPHLGPDRGQHRLAGGEQPADGRLLAGQPLAQGQRLGLGRPGSSTRARTVPVASPMLATACTSRSSTLPATRAATGRVVDLRRPILTGRSAYP